MRWLYMIMLFLMITTLSCGSHTRQTKIQNTTAKDSIVYKETIIIKAPVDLKTTIELPCKEDTLRPFKQTLKESDVIVSIGEEDGSLVVSVHKDSTSTINKEVLKTKEVISESISDTVKIKYKYPKWILYPAILFYLYIAYRISRIFSIPLRALPI